jgi:hypothetical protein
MLKKIMLLSLVFSLTGLAADGDKTIKITEKCFENIQKINKDGGKLFYYFKGAFQAVGKRGEAQHKPSDIIKFLSSAKSGIDEATQLSYMPATQYLDVFDEQALKKLDEVFQEKYDECQNTKEAWHLFIKYFKQNGLTEPLKKYKEQLIQEDQNKRELARHGIFISDDNKTLFFN